MDQNVPGSRNRFLRSVSKLVVANAIAIALVVAISPVLTRIYPPADFGVWSVFTSLTSVLSVIMALRYELAIVLPEQNSDAVKVVAVCILVVASITVLITLVVSMWADSIVDALGVPALREWLWLVPVNAALISFSRIATFWRSRAEEFGTIAWSKVVRSSANAVSQLALGTVNGLSSGGLILGQVIGQLSGAAYLMPWSRQQVPKPIIGVFAALSGLMGTAVRYKRFPLIATWSALLNVLALNLPAILLINFFNPTVAGFYALGNRVLQLPLLLFGESIADVFIQQAAKERNSTGYARSAVERVFVYLLMLGLPTLIGMSLLAPMMFSVIFGPDWHQAGEIIQILAPLIFLRLISVPLSAVMGVFERQDMALVWQAGLLLCTGVSFAVGSGWLRSVEITFKVYCVAHSILYLVLLVIVFRISGASIGGIVAELRRLVRRKTRVEG